MCQDEDENETKNESFRSFWIVAVTDELSPWYDAILKHWFVHHRILSEHTRTNETLVMVSVFVLAHEQAISLVRSSQALSRIVFAFVFVFVVAHDQPVRKYFVHDC